MIGIIGAMDEEIKRLQTAMKQTYVRDIAGATLYFGKLEQQDVLLAKCGIGKVNAGALTMLMALEGVKRLIFTGVAGAIEPELKVGDIIVSCDAIQHDVDVQGLGYDPAHIPGESLTWDADEGLIRVALEAAQSIEGIRATIGRVASGDIFLHDAAHVQRLYENYNASCVEMEGAAMAQIASKWQIPWVVIRSISDTADGKAHVDFRSFTNLAAKRAEVVVREMLRRLES